jgi:hypothetical protein
MTASGTKSCDRTWPKEYHNKHSSSWIFSKQTCFRIDRRAWRRSRALRIKSTEKTWSTRRHCWSHGLSLFSRRQLYVSTALHDRNDMLTNAETVLILWSMEECICLLDSCLNYRSYKHISNILCSPPASYFKCIRLFGYDLRFCLCSVYLKL